MSFGRRSSGRRSPPAGGAPDPGASPGKRTLTGALAPGRTPVPATAARPSAGRALGDPQCTQHIAQRGVAGPGEPLPHLDRIQRLFGRHDVRDVRAHCDPGAAVAARTLGAEAFTVGRDVAFSGAPSVHTAAHEAAHAVQQQAGLHRKAASSRDGDPHERHADAVAERVVRGEPAEALLDEAPANSGGDAVQRKVTIDELGPTPPYGPGNGELDFASLEQLLERRLQSLDRDKEGDRAQRASPREKLQALWQAGDHRFVTIDDLFHHIVDWGRRLNPLPREVDEGELLPQQMVDPNRERWFASDNYTLAKSASAALDSEETNAELLVQCAVAGGEMYRLLLGSRQPEVLYTELEGKPARASRAVAEYQPWPSRLVTEGSQIVAHAHSSDFELKPSNKPITGLMSVYTTALFLGDFDVHDKNLALVETADAFETVKIDPEAALSNRYLLESDGKAQAFDSLTRPERTEDSRAFQHDFALEILSSLEEGLETNEEQHGFDRKMREEEEEEEGGQAGRRREGNEGEKEKEGARGRERAGDETRARRKLYELLHSAPMTAEMHRTVQSIANTAPATLHSVIDRCIDPKFDRSISILKKAVTTRLRIFQAIDADLEGQRQGAQPPPRSPQSHSALPDWPALPNLSKASNSGPSSPPPRIPSRPELPTTPLSREAQIAWIANQERARTGRPPYAPPAPRLMPPPALPWMPPLAPAPAQPPPPRSFLSGKRPPSPPPNEDNDKDEDKEKEQDQPPGKKPRGD